jgi:hypothetical protein
VSVSQSQLRLLPRCSDKFLLVPWEENKQDIRRYLLDPQQRDRIMILPANDITLRGGQRLCM